MQRTLIKVRQFLNHKDKLLIIRGEKIQLLNEAKEIINMHDKKPPYHISKYNFQLIEKVFLATLVFCSSLEKPEKNGNDWIHRNNIRKPMKDTM